MKQEQFIARYQPEWQAFEHWLETHDRKQAAADTDLIATEEIPTRYRRLCQQLALARRRGYSPQVTERLQELMQRGHNLMYRTPPPRWRRALIFLLADFPQLVRDQAVCMWISLLLFAIPLTGVFTLLQFKPELIHGLMDPGQLAMMERMYDPNATDQALGRESGGDWYMFGYYIMNNTSTGLRTFASGLLAGIGTIFVLIVNGIMIGSVAGHLQVIGHGDPFWRFVAGHAPFELTAIVITGGAGLRLGFNLMAPGRRRRIEALIDAGAIGAKLCLGTAVMFFIAAFIEAFWSSIHWIPAWGKFTVSGLLWVLVLGWLWRGGHGGRGEPLSANEGGGDAA